MLDGETPAENGVFAVVSRRVVLEAGVKEVTFDGMDERFIAGLETRVIFEGFGEGFGVRWPPVVLRPNELVSRRDDEFNEVLAVTGVVVDETNAAACLEYVRCFTEVLACVGRVVVFGVVNMFEVEKALDRLDTCAPEVFLDDSLKVIPDFVVRGDCLRCVSPCCVSCLTDVV